MLQDSNREPAQSCGDFFFISDCTTAMYALSPLQKLAKHTNT